ncbi:MAG: hypothetical protein ACR2HQ_13575 [Ilumatobacteraceae bacterium]
MTRMVARSTRADSNGDKVGSWRSWEVFASPECWRCEMTDRRDEAPLDPPGGSAADDRIAAAEHRAAAAEHRAATAGERVGTDGTGQTQQVVGSKPTYGFGSLLALLSALAIAISAFLSWARAGDLFNVANANDVSIQFLWGPNLDALLAGDQPSLLYLLLAAAILVLLGTFIPRLRVLAILGGAVAVATAVLFFISMSRLISDNDVDEAAFELIGIGWWFAGIGGLVAILGAVLVPRRDIVR